MQTAGEGWTKFSNRAMTSCSGRAARSARLVWHCRTPWHRDIAGGCARQKGFKERKQPDRLYFPCLCCDESLVCKMRLAKKALLLWAAVGVVVVVVVLLLTRRSPRLESRESYFRRQFGQAPSLEREVVAGRLLSLEPDSADNVISNASLLRPRPLLRLLVLTFDRARSLVRCLESLNAAKFDGHHVVLDIFLDRARDGSVHNATWAASRNFSFKHGASRLHVHPRHVGVYGQWLSTWGVPPDNASEIAVFLEDDITVSPFFARWLWHVHEKYDSYTAVNGYALQGESTRHAIDSEETLLEGPPGESVFLYPVLGTWGFSPNAGQWRSFIKWYQEASRQPRFIPHVPGLKPSLWFKQFVTEGRADSMWSIWHIYHSYQNHLYTLYPNLPERQGLAHNWKEPGVHYSHVIGQRTHPNVLTVWRDEDLRLPESPLILDANGHIVGRLSPPPVKQSFQQIPLQ